MAGVRLGSGRGLLLAAAGCVISAGVAAELSSHAPRSTASTVRQANVVPQSELQAGRAAGGVHLRPAASAIR